MKHIFKLALICSVLFCSCDKDEQELKYNNQDNIYFDFVNKITNVRTDSVTFSFALFPEKGSDTVWLPVRISGIRQPGDRTFKLEVIDSVTTAVVGTHYEKLKEGYTMPSDSGITQVPIIIYNTDPALKDHSVKLKLKLANTIDFHADVKGWDTAKIIFSNQLVKPIWWDVWASMLGAYSRTKHELFYRCTGATSLPESQQDWQVTPLVLYYGRTFAAFLKDPQLWIDTHEGEGYVLETQSADVKLFYNTGNAAIKYTYRRNPADGLFYFIDETGNRIIPQM